jgi:hypothetical protein
MAVRRFAISMSLTIHFHSERSISVMSVFGKSGDGVEHDVSHIIHMLKLMSRLLHSADLADSWQCTMTI